MATQLHTKPGDLYTNASRSALKYVTPERDVIVEPVDAHGRTRIYVDVTPEAVAEHTTRSRRFIALCIAIVFAVAIMIEQIAKSFLGSNSVIWIFPFFASCGVSPLIAVYGRDVYDKFVAPQSHYIVVRDNVILDACDNASADTAQRLNLGLFIKARVLLRAKPQTVDAPGLSPEYDAISMVVVLLNARKHTRNEYTLVLINHAINTILEGGNTSETVAQYNLALAAVSRDSARQQ